MGPPLWWLFKGATSAPFFFDVQEAQASREAGSRERSGQD